MGKKLSQMTLEELWELFPIFLTEHKNCWAEDYRKMEECLRSGLAEFQLVRISHIGSTALHDIRAKDIVDILVEVARSENLEAVAETIEKIGFMKMSFSESRYSFHWGYTEEGFADKVYHLHLRYEGDHDELYFRDYLNDHPQIAREYERLKIQLWKRFEHNRDRYTDSKSEFIKKWTSVAKEVYRGRYEQTARLDSLTRDLEN